MDDLDLIAAYVRQLEEALVRAGRPVQPLAGEAAAHLCEDAARIARLEGCGEGEAARRAIGRFGDVSSVVAASRKHGRTLAASVARIASMVLLAVLAWELVAGVVESVIESAWYPTTAADIVPPLLFGAEIALTTIYLLRALAGRGRSPVLSIALQLNLALALAAFVLAVPVNAYFVWLKNKRPDLLWVAESIEPALVLMIVQCVAGLRALGGVRTRSGEIADG